MRISRIYIDLPLQADSELSLPADAAHHLAVVLRVKTGQPVILFNNTGVEAQAVIFQPDKNRFAFVWMLSLWSKRESPCVHLAVISRGERMDFCIAKKHRAGCVCYHTTILRAHRSEIV